MQNKNIETLEKLAEKYIRESKYIEARLIYCELIDLNSNNYIYLARLGYIELLLKNFQEATSHFLKATSICSNYVEGYNCLGYIAKIQGDFVKAKFYYNQALTLDQNYAPALTNLAVLVMNQEPEKAKQLLKKAYSINSESSDINFNLGLVHMILKDYKEAINFYSKAIQLNPNFILAIFNLGNARFFLRQFEDALNLYQKVIELDDSYFDAYSNIGTCLKELGDSSHAIEFYKKALKINPLHIHSLSNLAVLMIEKGNVKSAISLLKKVIKIDPNNPINLYNLAISFKENGQFLDSIRSLERAVSLDKDFFKAYAELIHLKARLCLWTDYSSDVRIASKIGIEGDNPIVHLGMFAMHDDPKLDLIRSKRLYQHSFNFSK